MLGVGGNQHNSNGVRGLGVGVSDWCVGGLVGVTVGAGCGEMLTLHNRAPVSSRSPCKTLFPFLSCTSSLCLSIVAVQSASQSLPRLSKLFVKPGMMWPLRASSFGIAGMARTAAPVEVLISPVEVLIVVLGALTLMLRSDASGVK